MKVNELTTYHKDQSVRRIYRVPIGLVRELLVGVGTGAKVTLPDKQRLNLAEVEKIVFTDKHSGVRYMVQ